MAASAKLYYTLTSNSSFATLRSPMPKKKKVLRIKLVLVGIFAVFIPIAISILLKLDPPLLLIIGALTSIATVLLLLWTVSPISKLIQGFETLSEGNLNHTLDIRSGDEFEDVALSFNIMITKVATLMQNIEKGQMVVSAEKNKLDLILESIIDGIIALDFSRNIILVNKAAEYLTGFSQTEMQGASIDNFIKLYNRGEEILIKNVCQPEFSQVAMLAGKNGRQTKVNVTSAAITEAVQTNLGCILIFHDISKEEELEQMKLDFVSMASHELKTPLTSIIGYLSVFINENTGKVDKEELELLEKSLVSGKQLYSMITNLLSVNKIERDRLSVIAQPLDYKMLLQKVVEDMQNQAKLKNITLTLNLPESDLPKVIADQIRISEVLDNLVANAINYTNPGGQVSLNISLSPAEVTTSITDTGIGIPKEAIPHLFSKFFRVSNTSQQARKGTGLGLYISKSIIERLNGKIWVESEFGKGTKFSFTLPVASITKTSFDLNQYDKHSIQSGNLSY